MLYLILAVLWLAASAMWFYNASISDSRLPLIPATLSLLVAVIDGVQAYIILAS